MTSEEIPILNSNDPDVLTWSDVKSFLDTRYWTNYDKMPLRIILILASEFNDHNWRSLSSKVTLPEVINCPELFSKIQWIHVFGRCTLSPELTNKILINKRIPFSDIVTKIKIEKEIYYRYAPFLTASQKWKYFQNQHFLMGDFKKFLACNSTNESEMALISSSPFLTFNLLNDTLITSHIRWDKYLTVHQYSSRIILDKIIYLACKSGDLRRFFVISPAWRYQKDLSPQLIKKLLSLCVSSEDKKTLWFNLSSNPHLDPHILDEELKTGNSHINLTSIQAYRKFPIWFLNKNTFYIKPCQYFMRNDFTPHFLARQILKYLELDPIIQKEYSRFLGYLVRFCDLDISFLRGLSELVIRNKLDTSISEKYWRNVVVYQELDLKFMKDYKNYLNADLLQIYQTVDVEMIEWFKKIGKIDWVYIRSNTSFYSMSLEEQEFYSTEYLKIHCALNWNDDDTWIEKNIYPYYSGFGSTDFYPRELFAYDLLHFYVKTKDRIDFSTLKIGDRFESSSWHHTSFGYPNTIWAGFIFMEHFAISNPKSEISHSILNINKYREFYKENKQLMAYPSYMKVRFKKSEYLHLDQLVDSNISRIYYSKTASRIKNISLVKSFEIIDVRYFNHELPLG